MTIAASTHAPAPRATVWTACDRASWAAVVVAVAFGLIGGAITAWTGFGDESGTWPAPDYRPPILFVAANLVYVVAIALAIPALIRSFARLGRGQWRAGAALFLAFATPVVVYLGFVELSHVIGCAGIGLVCRDGSFTGQMHLLHHTVVAAVPLILLGAIGRRLLPTPRAERG